MTAPLPPDLADHVCAHPGCDRFGPFGTGFLWRRGPPNAQGVAPLILLPGGRWWCAAHRPAAEIEPVTAPLPEAAAPARGWTPAPRQGRML